MGKFYAYLWLREDGTPYYAGKGSGRRAFESHRLRRVYAPPKDRVLIFERASEQEAFDTEMELICNWGRKNNGTGILINLTDGGENPPKGNRRGAKHTEESIARMREAKKGNQYSLGHAPSEEVRKQWSLVRTGKPWSETRRLKAA